MLADEIREYIAVFRRRWWLMAASALLAAGAAWWSERGALPVYTAEVLLRQTPEASMMSVGTSGGPRFGVPFASEVEIIRSRSVLESVVDSTGLQLNLTSRQDEWSRIAGRVSVRNDAPYGSYRLVPNGSKVLLVQAAPGDTLGRFSTDSTISGPGFQLALADPAAAREAIEFSIRDRQAAVERLRGRLTIEQGKGPDLIRVYYTSPDPELAALVVNTVARSYKRYGARQAREAAARRRRVIADQLVQLADSLQAVQAEMLEYQEDAKLLDPGSEGSALVSQRFKLENDIRAMEFERGLLESLVASLQSGRGNEESAMEIMARASDLVRGGEALYRRLQDLEAERSRLTASRTGLTSESPKVQVVDSLIASNKQRMRSAANESLDLLEEKLADARRRLEDLQQEVGTLPAQSAELSRRQQRVEAVQEVFDVLVNKYYEAQIAEGVETGDVQIVDAAPVPLWPDPSHHKLNLFIALVAGSLIGGVGAVAIDQLDSSIRDARGASEASRLDVVGTVPTLKGGGKDPSVRRLGKEAFRGLRTNLSFASNGNAVSSLAVSSAGPGEGKSTVAANLAVAFADQGIRTVLIDADLRRSQIHNFFGLERAPGLSDVLSNNAKLEEVFRSVSSFPHLRILVSGPPTDDAPELLAGARFGSLIESLRARFDAVVVDTPPLLAVSDAVAVAKTVEGTVVVAKAKHTEEHELSDAVEQLRQVDAPLIGIVLNQVAVKSEDSRYGYYYYYSAYDSDRIDADDRGSEELFLVGVEDSSS